jgi:TonB family protein
VARRKALLDGGRDGRHALGVRINVRAAVVAMGLCAVAARGVAAQDTLSLSGIVRDSLDAPIAGAQVGVVGSASRAVSDDGGHFTLRTLPRATLHITVRRLGFLPATLDWMPTSEPRTVEVRLTEIAHSLAAVQVREHREPYDGRLAGFNDRRSRKVGYFVTRGDIERKNGFNLTDVMRGVPGARVITMRGALGKTVLLRGATCPPLVFVDGFPASAGPFDLDMINIKSVEGIEVYSGAASIPLEFIGPRGLEQCGVIAIWSRPADGVRRRAVSSRDTTVDVEPLIASHEVLLASEVERQARYVGGSAEPIYPDSLWRAHVGGHVLAQFVVDATGAVETGTVSIVTSTHPGFAAAVLAAVLAARFEPAMAAGRPVRQLVQLPFNFGLAAGEDRPGPQPSRPTSASPSPKR